MITSTTSSDLYPWLVADIGGTNARFGLVRGPGERVDDVLAVRCAEFDSAAAAARSYLARIAARDGTTPRPRMVGFAVATAIHGDTVKLTNNAWTISRPAAAAELGAERVHLFNDFEALALALPRLAPTDVQPLGGSLPNRRLPMAVIGPGTGLGVATCVPTPEGHWLALAGEGGHVTASAADDFESEVLRHVRAEFGHVSAERVLSGIGLPALHRAVVATRGGQSDPRTPEEITRHALEGSDPHCVATMETFCAMLGGFAGNVALTVGARGGVFVAGGIAQQLGAMLQRSQFRARFEAKGRFRAYLAPIATSLVIAPHAALAGAAQGIENQLLAHG